MAKMTRSKVQASIDYPRSGETVRRPSYSVRVSAPGAASTAVSVDSGGWEPCREALGYWWYDWAGYGPGAHLLRIQVLGHDGQILAVKSRSVTVGADGDDERGA